MGACLIVTVLAPGPEQLARSEPAALLPPDEPYAVAVALERGAFPGVASRTRTVLVFERATGLTERDRAYLADLSSRLELGAPSGTTWRVQSPFRMAFLKSRLTAADGQAVLIVVNSDANYVTRRSQLEVEAIERIARTGLPEGLVLEITGEGGLGRDLNEAGQRALERTTWVTVTVVLLILLVVYRAPLAAAVSLLSIGLTAILAMRVLDLLSLTGWSVGAGERTFAVVLIFGSGTDFAMFWIARFRETLVELAGRSDAAAAHVVGHGSGAAELSTAGTRACGASLRVEADRVRRTAADPDCEKGCPPTGQNDPAQRQHRAAVEATAAVSPAITASAGTTIAGLSMLATADLLPSHNAGQVLAVALAISLAAALTLIPAVGCLSGRLLFWPAVPSARREADPKGIWRGVARMVTRHPVLTVSASVAALAWPVASGMQLRYRYDGLGVAPPGSSSARGQAIAERHFSAAQLFSWSCLIAAPSGSSDQRQHAAWARRIADALATTPGVADVWSLADPLGRDGGVARNTVAALAIQVAAGPYYWSQRFGILRFEVLQSAPPFSARAMDTCGAALARARSAARRLWGGEPRIHATGFTPYIMNIRQVTARDHARVTVCVVVAILVILIVWMRRPLMAAVMLGSTLLVYYAALGATQLVFTMILGGAGLDWKVRLILFVILVAVGQDYNVFLVSRLLEERRTHPAPAAAWRAIVQTGGVISNCGLIMAATLGSLMAAGLPLYRQLGFAFAFGIVLDTFLIRPAVVPGLYLILSAGRVRGRSRAAR